MNRPWTIYPARPLSDMPESMRAVFDPEYDKFKRAIREKGILIYEFKPFKPDLDDPFETTWLDLTCATLADLVVLFHPCATTGGGMELGWRAAFQGDTIAAAPNGLYVTKMVRGGEAVNANYRFMQYDKVEEVVPAVSDHFRRRSDKPKVPSIEILPPWLVPGIKKYGRGKLPVAT